jgi:L-lactate dehydrogenase complex protein LldE
MFQVEKKDTEQSARIYPEKPTEVYYFGTCLVDVFYPDAGMDGIRLLEREGITVIFPQAQSCCGQPAFNSGRPEEARAVARAQIKAFPKDIPVVVPSGSCAGMIKCHYPELFAGQPEEAEASALAARVFELTEFLVHVAKVQLRDKGHKTHVTWHSSCHALREMGIGDAPKVLLAQLENVTLTPLKRERECCGFGGTFSVKVPEISAEMVADKVADITATGADVLLGGDCGCLMNISGHMEKIGTDKGSRHIASFLWERTQ